MAPSLIRMSVAVVAMLSMAGGAVSRPSMPQDIQPHQPRSQDMKPRTNDPRPPQMGDDKDKKQAQMGDDKNKQLSKEEDKKMGDNRDKKMDDSKDRKPPQMGDDKNKQPPKMDDKDRKQPQMGDDKNKQPPKKDDKDKKPPQMGDDKKMGDDKDKKPPQMGDDKNKQPPKEEDKKMGDDKNKQPPKEDDKDQKMGNEKDKKPPQMGDDKNKQPQKDDKDKKMDEDKDKKVDEDKNTKIDEDKDKKMNEDKDKKINNDKGKNKQPPQKPDNKDNNEDDEEKKKRNARALYFCTNKEDNAVAAVELDKDGMVSGRASIWKTGGSGAQGVDWKTKQSAAPDSLFSSSALVVVESLVFVVNSGSHTLSMLSIDKSNPLSLKKVGAPWKLPGEFPNTVTASKKHRMVCVGMTGSKAGIACAPYSPESGIGRMDGNNWREFKLDQKTPPVGPGNTVSQVFFSGDESQLYATVKGRPEEQKKGWFSAYDIKRNETNAWLGDEEHRSAPDGTAELFGSAVIPGSRDVLVADSSFGIAVLGMDDKSKKAYAKHKLPVKDQKATCKAAISPVTKSAWVSDAGRNRLVEVSYQNDDVKVVSEIELSGNGWDGKSGLGDLKAGGEYVYALGAGTGAEVGITIVHAPSKKQVQYADLRGVGAGKSSMGMALWWS